MPELRNQLFIANGWAPARDGRTFETIDPSMEEVLATVARGGTEDVDDAVAAARAAFERPWRRVTPQERGRLLYRVARELEARIDEFAELETVDTGKPLAHAREILGSRSRGSESDISIPTKCGCAGSIR